MIKTIGISMFISVRTEYRMVNFEGTGTFTTQQPDLAFSDTVITGKFYNGLYK